MWSAPTARSSCALAWRRTIGSRTCRCGGSSVLVTPCGSAAAHLARREAALAGLERGVGGLDGGHQVARSLVEIAIHRISASAEIAARNLGKPLERHFDFFQRAFEHGIALRRRSWRRRELGV